MLIVCSAGPIHQQTPACVAGGISPVIANVSNARGGIACSRPSVSEAVQRENTRGDPPRSRSRLDSLAFFTRRCFRSLPSIESLEQARGDKKAAMTPGEE